MFGIPKAMQWIERPGLPQLLMALGESWLTKTQDALISSSNVAWLLSGGSTPQPFYEWLANQDLPWNRIHVFLVDDRCVPPTDTLSNQRMVQLAFQRCWLEGAHFHGMLPHLENPDLNLVAVTKEYAELQVMPYLCLLGMGLDGHTASLFPGDKSSELGLLMDSPDVLFTQAPSHPIQRISVSLPVVQRAKQVYVLFSGEDKKQVWHDAKANQAPISLVQESCSNLEVYFTN